MEEFVALLHADGCNFSPNVVAVFEPSLIFLEAAVGEEAGTSNGGVGQFTPFVLYAIRCGFND